MKNSFRLTFIAIFILIATAQWVESQISWIKDSHNPVLKGTTITGKWNSKVFMPSVIYNPDSLRYEMWHGGSYNANRPFKIGFAHSDVGVHWTSRSSPVLEIANTSIDGPSVIYESGQYTMWFVYNQGSLSGGVPRYWSIGSATSVDGVHWTLEEHPVFEPVNDSSGYFGCSVILDKDGKYKMWIDYTEANELDDFFKYLICALSEDGINWTILDTTDFRRGEPGTWDEWPYFGGNSVIQYENKFYLWYSGAYDSNSRSIGLMSSEDGIHWEKYNNPDTNISFYKNSDPVLRSGGAGNFTLVESPSVLLEGDSLRMWYTGYSNASSWCIGHAWSRFDMVGQDTSTTHADHFPSDETNIWNYPNPFPKTTTISFRIPDESRVTIVVYDMVGHVVDIPVRDDILPGIQHITWNASKLSNGIYFCTIYLENPEGVKSAGKTIRIMKQE